MNVQPITDTNKTIKWVSQHTKIGRKKESVVASDDNGLAFVTDFTSPADNFKKRAEQNLKIEKPERKGKPLSYTSENWIG